MVATIALPSHVSPKEAGLISTTTMSSTANWAFGGLTFLLSAYADHNLRRACSKSLDMELITLDNSFLDCSKLFVGSQKFVDKMGEEVTITSTTDLSVLGLCDRYKVYLWGYRAISTKNPGQSHTVEDPAFGMDVFRLYAQETTGLTNMDGSSIKPVQILLPVSHEQCHQASGINGSSFESRRKFLQCNAALLIIASVIAVANAGVYITRCALIMVSVLTFVAFLVTTFILDSHDPNDRDHSDDHILGRLIKTFNISGHAMGIKASTGTAINDCVENASGCAFGVFILSVLATIVYW